LKTVTSNGVSDIPQFLIPQETQVKTER